MARRTTDLLDVFRPGPPTGAATQRESARKARAPKPTREPGRRFEGVFLGPRQVLLGSSVVVLLLVLAFTVGLGMGRKAGRDDEAGAALRREQPLAAEIWIIRGRMARVDAASGAELTEARIVRELERKYRIPPGMVRVDLRGDPCVIAIGPFASETEAATFQRDNRLSTVRLWSAGPFRTSRPELVRVP